MKCAICKGKSSERADREWTWQPFGPDESPLCFTLPGSHYRGFPAIPVCGFCQREKIEMGEVVFFRYKGVEYRFCWDDDGERPVATSLWEGGDAAPINGQDAPDAVPLATSADETLPFAPAESTMLFCPFVSTTMMAVPVDASSRCTA